MYTAGRLFSVPIPLCGISLMHHFLPVLDEEFLFPYVGSAKKARRYGHHLVVPIPLCGIQLILVVGGGYQKVFLFPYVGSEGSLGVPAQPL